MQSFDVRSDENNVYIVICQAKESSDDLLWRVCRMMGGFGFDSSRIGDSQSVGEGGAGGPRGSCLEGTQISKPFESDALPTSVDDDNEHACIFEKTFTTT